MEKFFIGFVVGVISIVAVDIFLATNEQHRIIEVNAAHYDAQTAELVWDNQDVRYIITGERK